MVEEMCPDFSSEFVKKNTTPLMPKITKHWLGLYRDGALVGVFTLVGELDPCTPLRRLLMQTCLPIRIWKSVKCVCTNLNHKIRIESAFTAR